MGMIDEEQIANSLKKINLDEYGDPVQMQPLEQALWVLAISKDKINVPKLTAKAISIILLRLKEIDLNHVAIARAFAASKHTVKPTKEGGKVYYEILYSGRKHLNRKTVSSSDVYLFTGLNAWSDANVNFPQIIQSLKGEILIVDPYYGNGTFLTLSKFDRKKKIKFLTCKLGNAEQRDISSFSINLKRFNKEFKNIEIRQYANIDELHDRYIIANNGIVIIGHGLKDLANKESFIVYLPIDIAKAIIPILVKTFNGRWKRATKL